jgi:hypothetical protein
MRSRNMPPRGQRRTTGRIFDPYTRLGLDEGRGTWNSRQMQHKVLERNRGECLDVRATNLPNSLFKTIFKQLEIIEYWHT